MKNYTVKIIATLTLIAAMTSCTNVSADVAKEPDSTVKMYETETAVSVAEAEAPADIADVKIADAEAPAQAEQASTEIAPIPEGMQRITHVYSVIHEGLNTGLTSIGRNVTITMDIHDFLVAPHGIENCTEYLRPYGENGTEYQRCFGLSALSRVSKDFVFDGTEYDTSAIPGVWNPFEGREIHLGKTAAGTEYAIYGGAGDGGSFYGHVLVRASDEYVVEFTMSTNSGEETALLEKMIDSVTVAVDDTVYDGVPEGMQRITYPVSKIGVGIHSEAHKPQENTSVTMNVPDHLKYINDTTYFKYNNESGTYSRSLDIGGVFEVEKDFEFTGTIHQTGSVDGAWNPYEEDRVTVGTTAGGRSYEIYRRDHDNSFRVHVYAIVDDDHVVSFTYGDHTENFVMIEKMIDSVSIEIN